MWPSPGTETPKQPANQERRHPELEQLLAFFPGSPTPIDVMPVTVSAQGDLAILRMAESNFTRQLTPLPLATATVPPGELVTVIGYPMGIAGMVAKSPSSVYERLAYQTRRHRRRK